MEGKKKIDVHAINKKKKKKHKFSQYEMKEKKIDVHTVKNKKKIKN